MLKLRGDNELFSIDGVEHVILISEDQVWCVNENGWISYNGTKTSYDNSAWKVTDIDDLMDRNLDIFYAIVQHAFLWPEYSYLLDEDYNDEFDD